MGSAEFIADWDWVSFIPEVGALPSCRLPGGHLHCLGSHYVDGKICTTRLICTREAQTCGNSWLFLLVGQQTGR